MSGRNPDRRTPTPCANCGDEFLRTQNTRYCSTGCRFAHKFTVGDCWTWDATLDRHGYGTFFDGRNLGAHRVAFEMWVGPIPEGLHIDHLCRNRACVNPDHMEPVPQRVNTLRGSAPTAMTARQGHCKNGHVRTPENTYYYGQPRQQCRTCAQSSRSIREGRVA